MNAGYLMALKQAANRNASLILVEFRIESLSFSAWHCSVGIHSFRNRLLLQLLDDVGFFNFVYALVFSAILFLEA